MPTSVPAEFWLRQPDAVAAFTPSEGFCCTAFRVRIEGTGPDSPADPGSTGSWLQVLAEAPSWEALTARPSFYGNPLLFPFAYGIAGGILEYGGRTYPLKSTRWGRVAHGLVRDHAWTVDRTWTDGEGDHITASITTAGDEAMLTEYPFPFRLSVTYTLNGTTLTLMAKAVNLGREPMPFGFGVHPYLPVPLHPQGSLAGSVVQSDATHLHAGTPRAGEPAPELAPAADGSFDLRPGKTVEHLLARQRAQRPAGGLFLIYTKQPAPAEATGESGLRWSLADEQTGAVVTIESSADQPHMVLFAPADPTKVISPVIGTCLPGFLDPANRGRDLGLREIAPGASWAGQVTMGVQRPQ
jgi:galactose mutarotase-like enzyme